MNRFIMVIQVELKLLLRNFYSLFFAIAFPLMMLILFGEMYGNSPSSFFNGKGAMDVSVPAYICMIIAVTGIMSLPLTVAQYREKKILKRFMATPMNPRDILVSQVISNFILTIIGVVLLVLIGKIKYNVHFYGNIFEALLTFTLITLSIFSIGLLIAGVAPNGKAATAISYIIYFPMLFLSGATMPIEMMPEGVKMFGKILPLTHAVTLFKGIWLGNGIGEFIFEIVLLILVLLVSMFISIKLFKWA